VLSRGLLSGHWSDTRELAPNDIRRRMPRFLQGNVDRNLAIVETVWAIAEWKGATVAQAAIAWVHSRGDDIVPLVGARTRARLVESLGAVDVVLTDEQLAAIEAAIPADKVAGERYPTEHMAALDSER